MSDPGLRLEVRGVAGLPEIARGDDLGALVADAAPDLADGDVVVVTSKVVSKAEGRVRAIPPDADPEDVRQAAVAEETAAVVARRGRTRIVRTHHGFVMAAAGVDASNTADGTVLLLPVDPDASARALRRTLRERLGVEVAVVLSDTFGRPWRVGQTDVAVGAAGITVLDDHRGRTDAQGRPLEVTEIAIADEAAAAADLVKGKALGVPVAVVRGLSRFVTAEDGPGVAVSLRAGPDDMFVLGARDVLPARRTVRAFTTAPVPRATLLRAVGAALTAPGPYDRTPWRFVLLESREARERFVAVLRAHGPPASETGATADLMLAAPALVVACAVTGDREPGNTEAYERDLLLLSTGAAIENLLVALAVEGLGSVWVAGPLACPADARTALDLPPTWLPVAAIPVGRPATPPPERADRDPEQWVEVR